MQWLAPTILFSHSPLICTKILSTITAATSCQLALNVLLDTPPSLDDGEITDKGAVNQRWVLTLRSATVEALYDGQIGAVSV